jgi:hypothetical protein
VNWIYENRTKILGVLTALVSAIAVMTTSMTFDGLLEPTTIRWVAIVCNLSGTALGVLTTGVGISNTTTIRVAEAKAQVADAITTALNAPPPPSATKE